MARMEVTDRRPLLPGITVILLTLTAAVAVLYGMSQFADILGPLLLTTNLFIAAFPIQVWLVRKGVPRMLAQVALAITVFAVLAVFFYALTWSVTALVQELPKYQPQFWVLYDDVVELLRGIGISEQQLFEQIRGVNPSSLTGLLSSAVGSLTNVVSVVVVLIVMIFMMAFDSDAFSHRNSTLKTYQPRVWNSIADFIIGVRRYWLVTSLFGLIVAIVDVVALELLNVPLALVWGILSFLTNYIPNVGFVIGLVPPALMALLANGPVTALIVVIVYSVANFVIQSIIQPKFNGDAVGVTALVAFLSLLLWSSVLGALGALLALPMTLLAKAVLIDHDPQMRWVNAFISNDPDTAIPTEVTVVAIDGDGIVGDVDVTSESTPPAPDTAEPDRPESDGR